MLRAYDAHATGLPVQDARDDFARARRGHLAARAARWLVGRQRRAGALRTLSGDAALAGDAARLQVIQLASIVGTVEPSTGFDARFRPAAEHVRERWERIALAHRLGVSLPPIAVLERPDGYYVIDGRHRVSVSLALGDRDIDAWVSRSVASRERRT